MVSIIVPIYNVERYLSRCIESIIAQTYIDIEIILVDDGSPDSCPEICDAYAKQDTRIRVIHKENGGLSSARNVGIDSATGDYLMFVDSDDYIAPNMVETLYCALIKNSADMAICNILYVDENESEIFARNKVLPLKNETLNGAQFLERLFADKYWYYVVAWNKLYLKDLFQNIRFPLGKLHEDEFVIHHLFFNCKCIVSVAEAMYYYVQRENSIMNSHMSVKRLDIVDSLYDRCQFAYERQFFELYYQTLKRIIDRFYFICNRLDKKDISVQRRVRELQNQYRVLFVQSLKVKMPIKIRANAFLWYLSPNIYIKTRCFAVKIKNFLKLKFEK